MAPPSFSEDRYVEAGASCRPLRARVQFRPGMARRQIGPALPSPSERDAAMWYDYCISSMRKVPGADFVAKNTPWAGIEGVPLAEPARHEGGLDEEPENRFRRC